MRGAVTATVTQPLVTRVDQDQLSPPTQQFD